MFRYDLFKYDDSACMWTYMSPKATRSLYQNSILLLLILVTMKFIVFALVVLNGFFVKECFCLRYQWYPVNVTQLRYVSNGTVHVANVTSLFNETTLRNFTYTLPTTHVSNTSEFINSSRNLQQSMQVDCFGLGKGVATTLEWFFKSAPNGSRALDVQFFLSSRRQSRRVQVVLGEQFGLEWTDFRMERRTVIIVHGFLSHGNLAWIKDMEKALLEWDDVNAVVVDWSAGGNTWNYYKAAVNTRIVGYQISKFIEHITNATIGNEEQDTSNWSPLHLIGHSLGAHICGFAAKELKKRRNKWTVQRITGLDPAQPCFRNSDPSLHLHKNDAPFVDIIHTNGRFFMNLGLGLPEPLGHVDFYPNGGKTQPGCGNNELSFFNYLPIPSVAIKRAICSHGRSYEYLTESLMSARNCSFWAHRWDLTYRHFLQTITEPCDKNICVEMGIRAEMYNERGTFFVATSNTRPFCVNSTDIMEEVRMQLEQEYQGETKDR